jgi:hypothetical protein
MPRPRKPDEERRTHKLSVYLTDLEYASLEQAADTERRPLAQCVVEAIRRWLDSLTEPPQEWLTQKVEVAETRRKALMQGWICPRGHMFWTEWGTAMSVKQCPHCWSERLRQTRELWDGQARTGL